MSPELRRATNWLLTTELKVLASDHRVRGSRYQSSRDGFIPELLFGYPGAEEIFPDDCWHSFGAVMTLTGELMFWKSIRLIDLIRETEIVIHILRVFSINNMFILRHYKAILHFLQKKPFLQLQF